VRLAGRASHLGAIAVAGAALWFAPELQEATGFPVSYLVFGYALLFWVAQASSWNLFTGYSGYFSFGQGAFFGIGVYATATLAAKRGIPLVPSAIAGGLLASLAAVLIGVVVFRLRRLRGEIFALVTLAVAFVLAAIARVTPAIDGGAGVPMSTVPRPGFLGEFPAMMYRLGLLVAVVAVAAAYAVWSGKLGWGLFAIRDDEDVAETLGVPTFTYKLVAFGLSAFVAGLSGAFHALQIGYVTIEDVFNIRVPLFVILMGVLGGTRHYLGPVIGAAVVFTLTDRLNRAGLEDVSQLMIGALLIVVAVVAREGLYERVRRRPRWATVGAVASLAIVWVATPGESVLTRIAYAMIGAILVVLVPSGALGWLRRRPAGAASGADP
jgi:branched-chain amino acid transport system permease protein